MDVTPVIIRMGDYNAHDIKYATDFCQAKNLIPKIIDIDFDKFVTSEKILDIALESRSMLYQRPVTAYVAGQLDGTVILGDGEPYINLDNTNNTWNLIIDEHDFAVCNYLLNRQIPCVPHFNRYRPEMMSSYMLDPRMRGLAEHRYPGKLGSNSSKAYIYNRCSPFTLVPRQKYTGYELIEKSKIFNHPVLAKLKEQCKNYNGLVAFNYAVALTIYFDNNNAPELCSSISSRACWPTGAYRILNRMWKCNNKKQFLRRISDCVGRSAESQIKWLNAHMEPELYFCSRQTNYWDKWTINSFREQFNIIFNTDSFKYLTCPNECDDSCWQTIIYSGNEKLLEEWKRHQ
jgi:hypothetical protein